MPPVFDGPGESFPGLLLQMRGRIGLTQRELAAQLGVHVHSLQGWESGTTYPGAASLRALVEALLQAGGFSEGREADEAAAMWSAVSREAPRFRAVFDREWFAGALAAKPAVDQGEAASPAPVWDIAAGPSVEAPAQQSSAAGPRRQSWGDAPDVSDFLGRSAEREMLGRWVLEERCRVIAMLGLGGIGKTLL